MAKTEKKPTEHQRPIKVLEYPEHTLMLRTCLATTKDDKGEEIEVSLVNMHTPAVRYRGQFWVFELEALVRAVVDAKDIKPA